jgi:hypothetical protein
LTGVEFCTTRLASVETHPYHRRVAIRLAPVVVLVSLGTLSACTGQTVSLGQGPALGEPPPASTGEPPPAALPSPIPGHTHGNVQKPGQGSTEILCKPGSTQGCYDGPTGTSEIGACSGGVQTCSAHGDGYGLCEGEVRPSVELCGSFADENCDGVAGCTGDLLWSARFGDGELQDSRGVTIDRVGNVIITGTFDGAFELDKTHLASKGADIFLTKLDRGGASLWSKRFGDDSEQAPAGVAADTHDNVIVAGSFAGVIELGGPTLASTLGRDVFVAKLGPGGEHLWSKRFGDSFDQECRAVATDRADNIAITGTLYGTIDFGGDPLADMGHDLFVAKLGPSGEHLWSKRFGDTHLQDGFGVAFDSQGNVFVTGRYAGSVDFGGGPLTPATMASRMFVAKLDAADGHHHWSRSFGEGPGPAIGTALAVNDEGDVLVTGSFAGSIDFGDGALHAAGGSDAFVVKLDGAGGAARWSKRFGDLADQQGTSIAVDAGGHVIVTGSFHGAIDIGLGPLESPGGSNAFLLKLAPTGEPVWNKRFGEHKSARGAAAAVAHTGEVAVTGSFDGDADFGGGTLMSAGKSDGFLAKYRP